MHKGEVISQVQRIYRGPKMLKKMVQFKSKEELEAMYKNKGIIPEKEIITYCRIGERSSHTWFVLKYLLGYPNVKNYDGSWTEWGNMIANPIEK
jgi:thiosulfate/3-mercaptopyruvate sulfurtransferase